MTRLYLHLWEFTPGAALFIDGLAAASASATVLETGQPIHTALTANGIYIHTPEELRGCELPVIAPDVEKWRILD